MPEKLGVNLIPQEEVKRRKWEKFLNWILTYGRYIVIGTEIIVLVAFILRFKLDRDLKVLSDEAKAKQTMIESFGDLENQTQTLQAYLATIKKLQGQNPSYAEILTSLASLTPYDVIFNQVRVSSSQVSISATALSLGGFSSFVESLKRSKEFKNISLERVKEGTSGIDFSLQVNYQGSQK